MNQTQDLLVVCATKRLIPLDQKCIYRNNKSENMNLNRHHLVSLFSPFVFVPECRNFFGLFFHQKFKHIFRVETL